MSDSVMSFMCLVPIECGPHLVRSQRPRTKWGPIGTRLTHHSESTTARLKAPGVTAALGWRDRCKYISGKDPLSPLSDSFRHLTRQDLARGSPFGPRLAVLSDLMYIAALVW